MAVPALTVYVRDTDALSDDNNMPVLPGRSDASPSRARHPLCGCHVLWTVLAQVPSQEHILVGYDDIGCISW